MNHIQNIIDALDKFDDTPHGQTGKLLDQMMKDAKAALKEREPIAWLVRWSRVDGESGSQAHIKEDDARRGAWNLEAYSTKATTASVSPLFSGDTE